MIGIKYEEVSILKNFLILHSGFEKPTSDGLAAWNQWFESIATIQADRNELRHGRKITQSGTNELPFVKNSITGYIIIETSDLEEAEKMAHKYPIVDNTKIYEINKG
ncbi:hypothetical protein [Fodinibius sediminis]|uniref:YCII-related domain-containing protein n=1 Tax=Fodinibius sediminis TaxID=1214077 RepID=A0A521E646_9BACT|nr:hypothetical protein [Fodinibius sediminis]SMO79365.1 hypothetical protein SAMN06265218_113131 [Fodinibius sediminis]